MCNFYTTYTRLKKIFKYSQFLVHKGVKDCLQTNHFRILKDVCLVKMLILCVVCVHKMCLKGWRN